MELITFRFTDAGEQITLRLSDAARGPRGLQGEQGEVGPAGPSTTVVDALDSNSATSALSANQGRVLDGRLDSLELGLINHATNAAKLAAPTPRVGQKVRITGEANRIEEFLGGDSSLDANWLVVKNTVELFIENGTGDPIEINGVTVADGADSSVGWVSPTAVPIDTELFGLTFMALYNGKNTSAEQNYNIALDVNFNGGVFTLPYACRDRDKVGIFITLIP
jgi:hypothetical protein